MPSTKSVLYKAAKETLVEYFQMTSLNGFGLLYSIRRRKYQRLLWFMFIALGIAFASYVASYTVLDFLGNPTVTTLESISYAVEKVPYPAVAICGTNKLSRRAVRALVLQILATSHKDFHKDHNYWLEKFTLFGGYFDSDAVDAAEAREFQKELELKMGERWNIKELLKRLSPKCQDVLLKCYWLNTERNCAEMFDLYATPEGYCCIYNYQDASSPTVYPNGMGLEMGLTILLNTSTSDYFYTARNFHGFVVQIFESSDTPDSSSGGVEEILITAGQDVQVEFSVLSQIAATEAHGYSVAKRNCYFTDEYVPHYGYIKSDAKCLADCKVKSTLELCGCVPYYAGPDFNNSNGSYCTLKDLKCLQRYEVTWLTYRPSSTELPVSLLKDLPNSVRCTECLPSCSYNRYHSRKQAMKLKDSRYLPSTKKFLTNVSVNLLDEVSLVKFYFPTPYATQYRKNVLYNWYEILSNIGGVIGISMGCSFISGFEVIYFLGVRLWQKFLTFRQETS